MTHADEHITDVNVWRLRVGASERGVVFGWDYPGATLLEVRILRSQRGFAGGPHEAQRPAGAQRIVYQGETGSFSDRDVRPGATYWYTLYARHSPGTVAGEAMQSASRPGERMERGEDEPAGMAVGAAGDRPAPASPHEAEGRVGKAPSEGAERTAGGEWTLWARRKVRAWRPRTPRLRSAAVRLGGLIGGGGRGGQRGRRAGSRLP